ncbi:hypothetical protein [Rhodoferax sp.]
MSKFGRLFKSNSRQPVNTRSLLQLTMLMGRAEGEFAEFCCQTLMDEV